MRGPLRGSTVCVVLSASVCRVGWAQWPWACGGVGMTGLPRITTAHLDMPGMPPPACRLDTVRRPSAFGGSV